MQLLSEYVGDLSVFADMDPCAIINEWVPENLPTERLEECHSDLVSEIQRECVLSEVVFLIFCDLTYSVPNPVKPEPMDESFI